MELIRAFDKSGKMAPITKEEALRNLEVLAKKTIIDNSSSEDVKMQKIYFTNGEIYNYPRKSKN